MRRFVYERPDSVVLRTLDIVWANGAAVSADQQRESIREAACVLRSAAAGRTVPRVLLDILDGGSAARIVSEYEIRPRGRCLRYELRYECELTLETREEAVQAHRERQPYPSGERLTYVQRTPRGASGRRKALDTIGVSCYRGVLPRDMQAAFGTRRGEVARIAALRLFAQRLGQSFFFLPEFQPYIRDVSWLRPAGFFLQVLRDFWGVTDSAAHPAHRAPGRSNFTS